MTNKILSIVVAVILVVFLLLLCDPFMFWMPSAIQMIVLLGVTALMCIWAGFVIYEKSGDEREAAHKMYAGRIAYLSGIAVLTIALIRQGISHNIDPWVPVTLAVMVISKIIAHWYSEQYK